MNQELYYCEGCKKEQWYEEELFLKRGNICPQGCTRNKLVYLGKTENEIEKRRKEYFDTNGFDLEVKIQVPAGEEEGDLQFRKKSYGGKVDRDDLPW